MYAWKESADWCGLALAVAGTRTDGVVADSVNSVGSLGEADVSCTSHMTVAPALTCLGEQESRWGRLVTGDCEVCVGFFPSTADEMVVVAAIPLILTVTVTGSA